MPPVLGLDIGGAHLKTAHVNGDAHTHPFAVWRQPHDLARRLRMVLDASPSHDHLAVSMTAELCDCYETKADGVRQVLAAVAEAAGDRQVLVWQTDGRFVSLGQAQRAPLATAAANWLALATYVGRFAPEGPAVLIDIGSTTTDIIPLHDSRPVPVGRTDLERLAAGELVYVGAARTPVCSLVHTFEWQGRQIVPAAEVFATARDAHLLLGHVPEDPDCLDTADGRPATCAHAHGRMARMLCADAALLGREDAVSLARQVHNRQLARIRAGWERVSASRREPPRQVILSGSGEFLARALVQQLQGINQVISLKEELGPSRSEAACAWALAALCADGLRCLAAY